MGQPWYERWDQLYILKKNIIIQKLIKKKNISLMADEML
jgi:hypothetical protein